MSGRQSSRTTEPPKRPLANAQVSELHDRQARYLTEVPEIDGQYRIAERESGRRDEQVSERDHDPPALLLAIKLAGHPRRLCGEGLDGHRHKEFLNERFTARLLFGRLGPEDTVNEFCQTDSRQRRVLIARGLNDALDQAFNRVSATLGRDHDTGMESRISPTQAGQEGVS